MCSSGHTHAALLTSEPAERGIRALPLCRRNICPPSQHLTAVATSDCRRNILLTSQVAVPFAGYLGSAVLRSISTKATRAGFGPQGLGAASASHLYEQSLTAAALTISHANVDETVQRRLAVSREFQLWLERLPQGYPRTLETCRPEEILVFLQSHFITTHVGRRAAGQPARALI